MAWKVPQLLTSMLDHSERTSMVTRSGLAGRPECNISYQVVIDGESYRQRLSPHRALLEAQTGGD